MKEGVHPGVARPAAQEPHTDGEGSGPKDINLTGLSRDALLLIAEKACWRLVCTANALTRDEGDDEATEEEFGLDVGEVIQMSHENLILSARATIDDVLEIVSKDRAGG